MAEGDGLGRIEDTLQRLSVTTAVPDSTSGSDDTTSPAQGSKSTVYSPDHGIGPSRLFSTNSYGGGADGLAARKPSAPVNPFSRLGIKTSRTWISPDQKHMQDFVVIRNAMRRLFKNSDIAKWKYSDYVAHREAMVASQKALLDRKILQKEADEKLRLGRNKEMDEYTGELRKSVVSNLNHDGNLSLVLGEKTIWCENWQDGKEDISPWPTLAEMKWEGDDRAKTNVGRFLPLPREMGAPGITWSQLQVVEQYPLDQVAKIPTMEDIYLPVDEIGDEVKYDLITKDLADAMDAMLET